MLEWMEYTPIGICCSVRRPDTNPNFCRRDIMFKQIARLIRRLVSTGSESYFEAGLMKREQDRGL
jgi:hypothetical protein